MALLEKGDPYQTQDHLNHGIRGMLDPNPKCRKHLKIVVIRPNYNIWKHSIAGISILCIKTCSPNKLEMYLINAEKKYPKHIYAMPNTPQPICNARNLWTKQIVGKKKDYLPVSSQQNETWMSSNSSPKMQLG